MGHVLRRRAATLDSFADYRNVDEEMGRGLHFRPRRKSSIKTEVESGRVFTGDTGRTPSRSFLFGSYRVNANAVPPQNSMQVREHTLELASMALDNLYSPPQIDGRFRSRMAYDASQSNTVDGAKPDTTPIKLPIVIEEGSELSKLLKGSSLRSQNAEDRNFSGVVSSSSSTELGTACNDATLSEDSPLLPKTSGTMKKPRELEATGCAAQMTKATAPISMGQYFLSQLKGKNGLETNRYSVQEGFYAVFNCVPSVVLGLLLNVLDGLSYGMILFPLGSAVFSDLGPDGLSMFYISCITSQLVYSLGGSTFRGGVGSEMIEIIPFIHQMAFTVLEVVGEENPTSVIATTILAMSISSIVTGLVFFGLGGARLGSIIGFFPRHILVGCIGGVGLFLMFTGVEVSARIETIKFDLLTLQSLLEPHTLALWGTPLVLAIFLVIIQHFIRHALVVPVFFFSIATVFYIIYAFMPTVELDYLRSRGWLFNAVEANVPWYHFYTLFDFSQVHWRALLQTVPAMFALTFFGVLHVPINIPALALSTSQDNANVDRELIAHGISNVISGCFGSVQNYLVYANSLLFIRSGGDSRLAGIMLAIATAAIMIIGPTIIGFMPVMVVGALIFLLGIELLRESLYDSLGRVHLFEYLTILAIVICMGTYDFVYGILLGIVLACFSYVVQTSRKPAIRTTYNGTIAKSTVRRHPIQQRFLRAVGEQIQVVKLSGYMFFGTIVSVERTIRDFLDVKNFTRRPITFLVMDMTRVNGIDFSAAEAFIRMRRILAAKDVKLILCGVAMGSEVGRGLRSVDMWEDPDRGVHVYEDLNSALESCENHFLTSYLIHRNKSPMRTESSPNLDLQPPATDFETHGSFSAVSPRKEGLWRAVNFTAQEERVGAKWQNFKQPLPLLMHIFHELSGRNEDFWYILCPFLQREELAVDQILCHRGDEANGFYLLESGILKAEYAYDQGNFSETIIAGTTCGELPFFSETPRTAKILVERDCVVWTLDKASWLRLHETDQGRVVGAELLRVALVLTSERIDAITGYVLMSGG